MTSLGPVKVLTVLAHTYDIDTKIPRALADATADADDLLHVNIVSDGIGNSLVTVVLILRDREWKGWAPPGQQPVLDQTG